MTAGATNQCGSCERDVFQTPLTDHHRSPLIVLEDQTITGVRITANTSQAMHGYCCERRRESSQWAIPSPVFRNSDLPLRALHLSPLHLRTLSKFKAENLCALRARKQRNVGDT